MSLFWTVHWLGFSYLFVISRTDHLGRYSHECLPQTTATCECGERDPEPFIYSNSQWSTQTQNPMLISVLPMKSCHHIPVISRNRCLNTGNLCTSSFQKYHISEPFNKTGLVTVVYTGLLISNRISHCHHGCLRSIQVNRNPDPTVKLYNSKGHFNPKLKGPFQLFQWD